MKKLLLSFSVLAISYLLLATSVIADGYCQPIYGGGQTCVQAGNVAINKMVLNPKTNIFVNNLGVNDPKFAADQNITFQLIITNNGDSKLSKITVKDIFPQFVNFVSGPGSFDNNAKTLSFDVNDLNSKESKDFKIVGKVVPINQLSINNTACIVNQATATSNGQTSQDNAQFCIEKKVQEQAAPTTTKGGLTIYPPTQVITTPPTGPEALPLLALLPTGIAGFILRKKSLFLK